MTHLPDRIVDRQKYLDLDAALRKAVQEVQSAYTGICQIKELSPYPTSFEGITGEWVRNIVSKKKDLIKADQSLTEEEREERHKSWHFVTARAMKFINQITMTLEAFPNAVWVYDEKINNFWCPNIEEIVKSLSTIEVPDEAKEHYSMIWDIIEKVRELRNWEDTHEVKSQALAYLQDLTPIMFVEAWVNGSIKFTHRFEYLGIFQSNYKDPKNPQRVII